MQLMASFNWAWDQEGVLMVGWGGLTRMLLLWFLEVVDKFVRKKPETEAKQNRAEKDKQKT